MKSEVVRLQHEQTAMRERIKDNKEKIKLNKQLPYLVSNVIEVDLSSTTHLLCISLSSSDMLSLL